MATPDEGGQGTVTGQREGRQKVVLLPIERTMMKFHRTGWTQEAASRQMAPSKARMWAKMAENRGEIAQRIRNLNGFNDPMTGEENKQGACPPDARTGHVAGHTTEPVKTVAHCCPQKSRRQTGRAEQRRSAGPLDSWEHMCGWRSRSQGESSGVVLPPCQQQAVIVQHFVMVISEPTLQGAGALPGDGKGGMRREEGDPEGMCKENRRISSPGSSAFLLSCQLNGTSLLNSIELSRQDQSGTSEMDGMERRDAADRTEAMEVADPSIKVSATDLHPCTRNCGRRKPQGRSRYTWTTGPKKRTQGFVTEIWSPNLVIGPRSQTMRSRTRLCSRLGCRPTTMCT